MIELTDSLLEKGIAVMGFSAIHSMYQLGSPDGIIHKIQLSYVTESCVATTQGAQSIGGFCAVYLK